MPTSDYSSFVHGAVQYPVPAQGSGIGGAGASFLRDTDPALFYLLEFYASVINTHVGTRFMSEAAAVGAENITSAVAQTLPLDPSNYLTETQVSFPLLTAHRQRSKVQYFGTRKASVDEYQVSYVLPPLQGGEAARLLSVLRAVASIIDNRTEMGMDPAYTPSGSTAGASVWPLAGVAIAEVKAVEYGGYMPADKMFPAVMLTLELKETYDAGDSQVGAFSGVDVAIGLADPTAVTLPDVVDVAINLTSP